ncbi:YncE family protein [Niastella sp. OAS944]|uniref:YncE family protein n=1 Tax=Niastella sp. OAS944 TaxID=2664089 RepID=UPI00347B88BA|nr:DNA-binding beta-propeller fold protein YncE [Chitinophagaceae bacterium OAS944]
MKKGIYVMVLCSVTLLTAATTIQAQTRKLLALSKGDHTLAVVDPVSLKVIAKMPVGADPHEVIASTDGKTAYVSNTGGGRFHVLNVIDLVAQKTIDSIDTSPLMGPHGLAFANGKLWFSAEGSKAVGRYDPTLKKVDWAMGTGQNRTHMVEVTKDGQHLYATNTVGGTVSLLSKGSTEWAQTVVSTSRGVEGFDLSPDGKEIWAVAAENGSIYIIDTTSKTVIQTLEAKAIGANRLRITYDGKLALISSLRTGELFIYDVKERKELKRVKVGAGAAGLLIDTDNSRAFVACSPDNYVAVVNLRTFEIITRIDVGKTPDGLAWALQ